MIIRFPWTKKLLAQITELKNEVRLQQDQNSRILQACSKQSIELHKLTEENKRLTKENLDLQAVDQKGKSPKELQVKFLGNERTKVDLELRELRMDVGFLARKIIRLEQSINEDNLSQNVQ